MPSSPRIPTSRRVRDDGDHRHGAHRGRDLHRGLCRHASHRSQHHPEIGYTDAAAGFDAATCAVLTSIDQQSSDISQGVTEGAGLYTEQGAGDQGLMFGLLAMRQTSTCPWRSTQRTASCKRMADVRKAGIVGIFRPDSKSQVTVQYEKGKPKRIDTIVIQRSTRKRPRGSMCVKQSLKQ